MDRYNIAKAIHLSHQQSPTGSRATDGFDHSDSLIAICEWAAPEGGHYLATLLAANAWHGPDPNNRITDAQQSVCQKLLTIQNTATVYAQWTTWENAEQHAYVDGPGTASQAHFRCQVVVVHAPVRCRRQKRGVSWPC